MNIITQLLDIDLSLLQFARGLIAPEYALLIQIVGEFVVFHGALLLIVIWLYGTYSKNNEYKQKALAIFFTIVTVFLLYALINLGIPQWRPGAIEAVQGIAPLIPHPIDNSFPSGHALFSGALLFGICSYFRRGWLIILTIVIALMTLVARVIGGVHYLGDILGGLFFGILGAYLLMPLVTFLVARLAPIFIRVASWIRL